MSTQNEVEIEYLTLSKKPFIAYMLWLFCGVAGGHNFYIGRYGIAWLELGLLLSGIVFGQMGRGGPMLGGLAWIVLAPFVIYDLFIVGTEVKKYNLRLRGKLNKAQTHESV